MIYNEKTMIPCIDWFRGVIPCDDVKTLFDNMYRIDERLDISKFVLQKGSFLNFKKRFVHTEMPSFIVAFNPSQELDLNCLTVDMSSNNKGIMINFSGDCIRWLGDNTLRNLLCLFNNCGIKCTRIDFAMDFYDRDNKVVPMLLEGFSHFVRAENQGDLIIKSNMSRSPSNIKQYVNFYQDREATVNYSLGNHGSQHGMIRLYDKYFESKYGRNAKFFDKVVEDKLDFWQKGKEYWYRCEVELHNGNHVSWAQQGFKYLIQSDFNICATYGQVLSEFISVSTLDDLPDVISYCRFSVFEEWETFISELSSIIHFV